MGNTKDVLVAARRHGWGYGDEPDLEPGQVFKLAGLAADARLLELRHVVPVEPETVKPCPRCSKRFAPGYLAMHLKVHEQPPAPSAAEEEAQRRAAIEAKEAADRADYAFARSNPPLWNEILSMRERLMRERAATRRPAPDPVTAAQAARRAREIERNRVQAEERRAHVRREVARRYGL